MVHFTNAKAGLIASTAAILAMQSVDASSVQARKENKYYCDFTLYKYTDKDAKDPWFTTCRGDKRWKDPANRRAETFEVDGGFDSSPWSEDPDLVMHIKWKDGISISRLDEPPSEKAVVFAEAEDKGEETSLICFGLTKADEVVTAALDRTFEPKMWCKIEGVHDMPPPEDYNTLDTPAPKRSLI